jgi:hypothetical protein
MLGGDQVIGSMSGQTHREIVRGASCASGPPGDALSGGALKDKRMVAVSGVV